MGNESLWSKSPLDGDSIKLIDETSLSSLEKHHLRLMAHCLECFKSMPERSLKGQFPQEDDQLTWCLEQTAFKEASDFIPVFLKQLSVAAIYLESVACSMGIEPMDLKLDHLIDFTIQEKKK